MSTFEDPEDPSLSSSGAILTDSQEAVDVGEAPAKKDKEEGITVPKTPKFTVFTGMLLFAFAGIGLAGFLMYRELETYNFEKDVPAGIVKPLPPLPPAPTFPRSTSTAGIRTAPAAP